MVCDYFDGEESCRFFHDHLYPVKKFLKNNCNEFVDINAKDIDIEKLLDFEKNNEEAYSDIDKWSVLDFSFNKDGDSCNNLCIYDSMNDCLSDNEDKTMNKIEKMIDNNLSDKLGIKQSLCNSVRKLTEDNTIQNELDNPNNNNGDELLNVTNFDQRLKKDNKIKNFFKKLRILTLLGKCSKIDKTNSKKSAKESPSKKDLSPVDIEKKIRQQKNMKKYYEENKEKHNNYVKKYTELNKDRQKEYMRNYYMQNKERLKTNNRKYYSENKECKKDYQKRYRELNKEKQEKLSHKISVKIEEGVIDSPIREHTKSSPKKKL